MKMVLVYSPVYLEHNPGAWHPESPLRLRAIVEKLKQENLWNNVVDPRPAEMEEILSVHDKYYVESLKRMARTCTPIDSDTPVREETFEIALLAAGGALVAGELVAEGKAKYAFALVRPPGHHASRDAGGGFCYLNNIAIMAESLKEEMGKVMIFDFDAHHGNGTQDIFYEDPDVLYVSVHQSPLYPETGRIEEIGRGKGRGFNINVPVPPGTGDGEYATIVEDVFRPLAEQFEPNIIAVSAGFDGHREDPLAQLELSSEFYGWMAQKIFETAEDLCGGRAVFVLEGGYSLKALAESVANILMAANGAEFRSPAKAGGKAIEKLRIVLSGIWKI